MGTDSDEACEVGVRVELCSSVWDSGVVGAPVGLGKSFPYRPWLLIQQMEKAAVGLR